MDVANTLLVNHVKSVCVCQCVHTFSHPVTIDIRALVFSNSGEKDVRFERKNWQLRSGFSANAPETDGIREALVRISTFFYI